MDTFDAQFGAAASGATLYQQHGPASSFLTVLNQAGGTALPTTDPVGAGGVNWEVEESLDVEGAHAVAPGAQIVLVEANGESLDDLMSAVRTAAGLPGVSVVSMSWGFVEGQDVLAQDEAKYDSDLTTPASHQGVVFVASTGDYGAGVPQYPAFSPNVVSVGGTSLTAGGSGSIIAADGMLYLYTDKGECGLAKADPSGFDLTGQLKIPQLSKFPGTRKTSTSAKVWSHPALANGHLYLRDCEFMYCYDVKGK